MTNHTVHATYDSTPNTAQVLCSCGFRQNQLTWDAAIDVLKTHNDLNLENIRHG